MRKVPPIDRISIEVRMASGRHLIASKLGKAGEFGLFRASLMDVREPCNCPVAHATGKIYRSGLRQLGISDGAQAVENGFQAGSTLDSRFQRFLHWFGMARIDREYRRLNRAWHERIKYERPHFKFV